MGKRIIALARLIILDGLRRNALIGLSLFALVGIGAGLLFVDFIPRDIGRACNDYIFSIIWLTGIVFLLFHAVQVMAWDNDGGILYAYLARPISRTEYGLGIFVGLGFLLLVLNCILGAIGWLLLIFIKSSVSLVCFQYLSFPFYLFALLGLYWIQLMILAVILLISSAVRGSFPVLLLTISYYFICSGLPVARKYIQQRVETPNNGQLIETMLKWLTALFPNFSWLDFKTLVASSDRVPVVSQLIQPFVSSTLYIMIILWFACMLYERRDLQ